MESPCLMCGQCVTVCPTGALMPKTEIDKVDFARAQGKFVVVQAAPAVRAALGEEFGMPIVRHAFLPNEDVDIVDTYRQKRAAALYTEDEHNTLRQPHNYPQIVELYDKYLGEPNGHLAHKLLHTTYAAREPFRIVGSEDVEIDL